MVLDYPRTVWKNSHAEHKVTGKTYKNIQKKHHKSLFVIKKTCTWPHHLPHATSPTPTCCPNKASSTNLALLLRVGADRTRTMTSGHLSAGRWCLVQPNAHYTGPNGHQRPGRSGQWPGRLSPDAPLNTW